MYFTQKQKRRNESVVHVSLEFFLRIFVLSVNNCKIYEYLNICEATKFNLYLKTAVAFETVHDHCLWEREFVSIITD